MLSLVNLYILVFHCKIPLYDIFLLIWVSTNVEISNVEISLLWIKIEFNSWLLKSKGNTFNHKNVWKRFQFLFCFCFWVKLNSWKWLWKCFDFGHRVWKLCRQGLNSMMTLETQLITWADNCHRNVMYLNIFLAVFMSILEILDMSIARPDADTCMR